MAITTKTIKVRESFEKSINVEDLPDYIRYKSQQILHQFYALPEEESHSCAIGSWEYLQPLNRFSNIIPYDLYIVPVPPDLDNPRGYVNASFISVRNCIRKYIATQAPLPNTLNHFWSTIWHHRCQVIIMLASCVEMGLDKCTKYWPDTSMNFGDIRVQVVAIKVTQDYNVMDLKLTLKTEHRLVRHFHYKSWPDHGIPYDTNGLVAFLLLVENFTRQPRSGNVDNEKVLDDMQSEAPILVHCSAGVGRTGAFMAISILKDAGLETGYVNVYKCVRSLRNFRAFMVQNEEQYMLIYRVTRDILCNVMYRKDSFAYLAAYDNVLLQIPRLSGISPLKLFLNLQPPQYRTNVSESLGSPLMLSPETAKRRYTRAFMDTTDIKSVRLSTPPSDPSQSFLELPFELCGVIIMVHQDVTAKMLKKRCDETRYKKAAANIQRAIQAHYPATDQELEINVGDIIISEGEGDYWCKGVNTRHDSSMQFSKLYPAHKVVKSDLETIQPTASDSMEFVCLYLGSVNVDYHIGVEFVLKAIDTVCASVLKKTTAEIAPIKPRLCGMEIVWKSGAEKVVLKQYVPKHSKIVKEYQLDHISYITLHPQIARFFAFISKESGALACHIFFCDASAKAIVDLVGTLFQYRPKGV